MDQCASGMPYGEARTRGFRAAALNFFYRARGGFSGREIALIPVRNQPSCAHYGRVLTALSEARAMRMWAASYTVHDPSDGAPGTTSNAESLRVVWLFTPALPL